MISASFHPRTDHPGDWLRAVLRLFQCAVCEYLGQGQLHRPRYWCHHISLRDALPVLLRLPPAVPHQQHRNQRVSPSSACQNNHKTAFCMSDWSNTSFISSKTQQTSSCFSHQQQMTVIQMQIVSVFAWADQEWAWSLRTITAVSLVL